MIIKDKENTVAFVGSKVLIKYHSLVHDFYTRHWENLLTSVLPKISDFVQSVVKNAMTAQCALTCIWAASWQNQRNGMCALRRQISLGIRPVWSESSLCAQWVAKDPSFLHADSEDSDQTGRMPGLIWVFAGRTCHFVRFVMRRLNYHNVKLGIHIHVVTRLRIRRASCGIRI